MDDSLNGEQRAAVDCAHGSVVLAAGAGSGKTRVLVARYLKHLAEGSAVRQLVAITFTDKAAREMRGRIRDAIGLKIRNANSKAERDRWAEHELHLETARIGTIHAFGSQLLKDHAAAAGLAADFEVRTGGPAASLRSRAVNDALRDLLVEQTETGEALRELIVLFGFPKTVQTISHYVDDPDRAAWERFLAKSPQAIAAEWTAAAKAVLPAMVAQAIDAFPSIHELESVTAATRDGQATLKSVLAMLHALKNDPFTVDATALRACAQVGHASTGKKLYGAANYETVRDGFKAIREGVIDAGALSLTAIPANLPQAAVVSQHFLRVAWYALDRFAEVKRRENVIDHADQLQLVLRLLESHEEVRKDVQASIQFLLLDELQDTDPVQMRIVELLLGDRFRNNLFAVGDVKQSIYRFRGAEVDLFHALRAKAVPEARLNLAKNFRSRPGVLAFVNRLCAEWFPGEALLECTKPASPGHAVEFVWTVVDDDDNAYAARRREATAIANRIAEMIAGPTARSPGDIVLLFRAMSNVAIYEEALRKKEIDYYLVGGRAYFAQQEVFDIANALRAIDNPYDSLALFGLLRSPIAALSDDAITVLATHEDGLWGGLLDDAITVPVAEKSTRIRIRELLMQWRTIKDSLRLAALLQRILDESSYDAALLLEPLGERKLANLWKLIDTARDFDTAGASLAEFAAFLREHVASQPREEQAATVPEKGAGAVRLMTIHQAKGLEFPVVFVPDFNGRTRDSSGPASWWQRGFGAVTAIPGDCEEGEVDYPGWPAEFARTLEQQADDAEMLRVLYVAFTRAEELLILSGSVTAEFPEKGVGPMAEAVARAVDLAGGSGLAAVTRIEAECKL